MTRESMIKVLRYKAEHIKTRIKPEFFLEVADALEQQSEDAISRQAVIDTIFAECKDCKWWKDSDGVYRRGVGAESHCPINRREVFEGNGYCYIFEPQAESEGKE